MKILYFDCFSGISGDMTVGALLDLGVPQNYLLTNLAKLGISDEYQIKVSKSIKSGIEGTQFDVILVHEQHTHEPVPAEAEMHTQHSESHDQNHAHEHAHEHEHEHVHHGHEHEHDHHEHNTHSELETQNGEHAHADHHGRNLFVIEGLIDKSKLNDNIKRLAKEMFLKVAEAESIVHGKNIYEVHFHEVGAVDSIVDIVGAAICIDYLKPDRILSSPINTGSGFVRCQHGMIPVPAPATIHILRDVPIYCDEREFELTTPTGAAIIKVLASEFKKLPNIRTKKVGYGCGKRNTEKPNLLRVLLAEDEFEEVSIFETTIDDMNPQIYSYFMDRLFEAGAKDVYLTPVYMKKNRPGIVVTITAPTRLEEEIRQVVFRETTSIGIRRFGVERTELDREFQPVQTKYGNISCKLSSYRSKLVNVTPEYEDMKEAAEHYNVPLKEIYSVANEAIRSTLID